MQEESILPDYVEKLHNGPFLWVAHQGHYGMSLFVVACKYICKFCDWNGKIHIPDCKQCTMSSVQLVEYFLFLTCCNTTWVDAFHYTHKTKFF